MLAADKANTKSPRAGKTLADPVLARNRADSAIRFVAGRITRRGSQWRQVVALTNLAPQVQHGPLRLVVTHLRRRARLSRPSGFTRDGNPYMTVYLGSAATLDPGRTVIVTLIFRSPSRRPAYTLRVLAGPGTP